MNFDRLLALARALNTSVTILPDEDRVQVLTVSLTVREAERLLRDTLAKRIADTEAEIESMRAFIASAKKTLNK